MLYPVNKPVSLATAATAAGTLTIIAVPSPTAWAAQQGAFAGVGAGQSPPANLTINDCATLDGANSTNSILDIPWTALAAGMTLSIPSTSTGLTVSQVPPAMAVTVDI